MNWRSGLKIKIRQGELLRDHTTFRIGGPAKYFIEPEGINDLKLLLNLSKEYKIQLLLLGAGSNILAGDAGIDALVVKLNSAYFKSIKFKDAFVEIGSAALLNHLVFQTQAYGLSGAEFLAGIPGTAGGALVMNAGISERIKGRRPRAKGIGDIVEAVTVMDYDGNIRTLDRSEIKFEYRRSNLSKYIILSACLKLKSRNKRKIKDKINGYLERRRISHDLSYPSAGCVFKNPSGYSAGELIDLCGLKERRVGDACISGKHANFILNLRSAKAKDVFTLMGLMKKEVEDKFNITLEPEIKIWQ